MTPKKEILIVEDNELNRAILSEILSSQYRVLEAEHGQQALELLQLCKERIALILLDVMMPVMDGYTFLDKVKEDPVLSLIPVIVTTQGNSEADEVAALAHGATDFVPKPYRPQVILHRVASLIKLRETAAMVNQFQYDRLTGLYSKEFFYQKVRECLDANPEQQYAILCSNIENFKLYNDNFGREAGDRLLLKGAAALKVYVGQNGICGRYSADRFLILREQEKLEWDVFADNTFHDSDELGHVSIKLGIYEIQDRDIPVEQMCDRALLAVESIKGRYDKPFAVYDDALRGKLLREKAITDAMEDALTDGQFIVYLQPKYSLNDVCMAGAEALVRWIHPEWGFMSPGEFIPLFEKNGFIPQLDEYVWEQVCIQLQKWKRQGYTLLPISVNVSRADVYQVNLADRLLELTKKYGVDPQYLHLEITESAYTENPDQIISTVTELRKLGFIVEMDDFGSGYSSLNMLSQMTLDILKLDMKFIQSEMAKPVEQSILNDIITMAHRMRLEVVAEGVETREQMKRLQDFGCDYVQGYYFAKPMPVAEFEELWRKQQICALGKAPKEETMQTSMQRLLVVDEDAQYREKTRKLFEGEYPIVEAADADSALACLKSEEAKDIAALIVSMTLPDNGAAALLRALRQEPAFWELPVLATIPTGEKMEDLPLALETDDFICKCHPMFDLKRRMQRLIDIANAHKREMALLDEAGRDHLTGLFNRRGLQAAIEAIQKEEMPLALFLFDLDNLKMVNDTYGHEIGDRMIQTFAELLQSNTRPGDILCRYGGDEFMVILKCLYDGDSVIKKGMEICQKFENCLENAPVRCSCSAGIALCRTEAELSSELVEHADQALYRAKRENKGGCCLWDEKERQACESYQTKTKTQTKCKCGAQCGNIQ